MRPLALFTVAIALLLTGCGSDSGGGEDAALPVDAAIALDAPAAADAAIAADQSIPPDLAAAPPDLAVTGQRVRLLAANITSGARRSYEAPGVRIFQGLHADVALIQEFNCGGNTAPEIRTFVDDAFGPAFTFYRESGNGVAIPNGVVSRFPILDSGAWDDPTVNDRNFVWARLDVPGPRDLWAVSVHLPTTNGDRPRSATALVAAITQNIPAGDLLAIGGDFNTDSRDEAALMTISAVAQAAAPWPADQNGNGNTSAPRTRPYDWLIVDGDLAARLIPVEIGASRYPSGLVFDSRVYTPLAEVQPVLAGDSGAVGMQHMAVVRDVALEP